MKAKNYRDYIYGNYSDTLIVKQITGDLKRENVDCQVLSKKLLAVYAE